MIVNRLLSTSLIDGFILAVGLCNGLLIAKYLGSEVRGELGAIQIFYQTLITLSCLSITDGMLCRSPEKRLNEKELIYILSVVCVFNFFVLTLLYILWPELFLGKIEIFLYVSVNAILYFITQILIVSFQIFHFKKFNLFKIITPVVTLSGTLFLAYNNYLNLITVLFLNVISNIVLTLFGFKSIVRFMSQTVRSHAFILKGMLFALSSHFYNVLSFFCKQIDKFFAVALLSKGDLGLYIVSYTLTMTSLATLSSATTSVILPKIAKETDLRVKIEEIKKASFLVTLMLVISSSIIYVILPPILLFILGEEYAGIDEVVKILVLCFLPFVIKDAFFRLKKTISRFKMSNAIEVLYLVLFSLTYFINLEIKSGVDVITYSLLYTNAVIFMFVLVDLWVTLSKNRSNA